MANEFVTCDWQSASDELKDMFPDSVAFHKDCKQGNMGKCSAWECPCGKGTTDGSGFSPCDAKGNEVEPTEKDWPNPCRYVCVECGRIIVQETGEVVGKR